MANRVLIVFILCLTLFSLRNCLSVQCSLVDQALRTVAEWISVEDDEKTSKNDKNERTHPSPEDVTAATNPLLRGVSLENLTQGPNFAQFARLMPPKSEECDSLPCKSAEDSYVSDSTEESASGISKPAHAIPVQSMDEKNPLWPYGIPDLLSVDESPVPLGAYEYTFTEYGEDTFYSKFWVLPSTPFIIKIHLDGAHEFLGMAAGAVAKTNFMMLTYPVAFGWKVQQKEGNSEAVYIVTPSGESGVFTLAFELWKHMAPGQRPRRIFRVAIVRVDPDAERLRQVAIVEVKEEEVEPVEDSPFLLDDQFEDRF